MYKLAATTVFCSLALSLCADAAQARCCRRTSACCCAPAPTCCAPAPTSATPMPSDAAPPAEGAAPAPPPAPSAGTYSSDPSQAVAQNPGAAQTYRSFSYDTAAPAPGYSAAPQPTIRTYIPDRLKWRADRKLLRNY